MTFVQVLVSSPSDLVDERDIVAEAVAELNTTWRKSGSVQLAVLRWETDTRPAIGGSPQSIVNAQLGDDYDIFIGIMGARFGTPTDAAGSGTEEEFDRAVKRLDQNASSVAVMFYFKETPPPSLSDIDPEQLQRVQHFRRRLEKMGLIKTFKTKDEFGRLIRMHLTQEVQDWEKNKAASLQSSPREELPQHGGEMDDAKDEEGFIDLLERGEDAFTSLGQTMERIAAASHDATDRATTRTAEMNAVANTGKPSDTKALRRVASATADDLGDFAARIDAEVPIYSETFKRGIDAFVSLMAMPDAKASKEELQSVFNSTGHMIEAIERSTETYTGLQNTIRSLPRMTTVLNRGKRRVVQALERLIAEFQKSLRLSRELHDVVKRRIDAQQT